MKSLIRRMLPFSLRVRWQQFLRHVSWRLRPLPWAVGRGDPADFPCVLDERSSPLHRVTAGPDHLPSDGKEQNIPLAAAAVNRLVIGPGEVFSFCRTVGPTTPARGYVDGLEMHDGRLTRSTGGGLCQLANLLFGLAVHADAEIVERHRHSLDLFPDADRTVPFGFGATVFYNHVDFQFRNTLDRALLLETWVEDMRLYGRVRAAACPGWRVRVVETDHRFFREGGQVFRENRLWKEKVPVAGEGEVLPVPLFATRARVMYPADHLIEPESP